MKNSTTLQINSLEALERLLGGDTELEVSLRQSAAAAFAVRHLSDVISEPLRRHITTEVTENVMRLAKDTCAEVGELKYDHRNGYQMILTPSFLSALKEKVETAVDVIVRKIINDAVDARVKLYESTVEREVNQSVVRRLEPLIDRHVKARLDDSVDSQLAAIVGYRVKEKLAELVSKLGTV